MEERVVVVVNVANSFLFQSVKNVVQKKADQLIGRQACFSRVLNGGHILASYPTFSTHSSCDYYSLPKLLLFTLSLLFSRIFLINVAF